MRATRSDDTVLEGAFVPDKYIARVIPAGVAGVDGFIIGFFTWGLTTPGILGRRALPSGVPGAAPALVVRAPRSGI